MELDFPDMDELPSSFPEKDTQLFPKIWKWKRLPTNSHKTPDLDSKEWKAVMDFKNSALWKPGDLQKFANYFGVTHCALSTKIKKCLRPQRDNVGSSQGEPPTPHTARRPPALRAPSFPPAEPRRRRLTLGAETFAQV